MRKFNNLNMLILVISACGCKGDCGDSSQLISRFNEFAKQSFSKNFDTYELSPLTEVSRCILREGVTNYLDDINNWELTVVDSFYLRNYPFSDLGIYFTFIANKKGDFYFVALPKLHEYFYSDKYYQQNENLMHLKDSLSITIANINSPMLDHFLESEVFVGSNPKQQFEQANRLLPKIFPDLLTQPLWADEFLDSLENQPQTNRDFILEKLQPVLDRRGNLTNHERDYLIYNVRYIGFVFLEFFVPEGEKRLRLNMYFIPLKYRYAMSDQGGDRHRYQGKCY